MTMAVQSKSQEFSCSLAHVSTHCSVYSLLSAPQHNIDSRRTADAVMRLVRGGPRL